MRFHGRLLLAHFVLLLLTIAGAWAVITGGVLQSLANCASSANAARGSRKAEVWAQLALAPALELGAGKARAGFPVRWRLSLVDFARVPSLMHLL